MQLSFFQLDDPVLSQVRDELLGVDINNLTPLRGPDQATRYSRHTYRTT